MRKAPRYLKEDVKWILFLLLFSMMSGISDSVCFFARVRVEGKNIASVLDLWFGAPTCIELERTVVRVPVRTSTVSFCPDAESKRHHHSTVIPYGSTASTMISPWLSSSLPSLPPPPLPLPPPPVIMQQKTI